MGNSDRPRSGIVASLDSRTSDQEHFFAFQTSSISMSFFKAKKGGAPTKDEMRHRREVIRI